MQIKTIRASAGRTIPHPTESYSNMKFFVEMTAEVEEHETADDVTTLLQEKVAAHLQVECENRLADIERKAAEEEKRLRVEREKQQAIWEAERAVNDAQRKLDALKNGNHGDLSDSYDLAF